MEKIEVRLPEKSIACIGKIRRFVRCVQDLASGESADQSLIHITAFEFQVDNDRTFFRQSYSHFCYWPTAPFSTASILKAAAISALV
ncbi:hypothetical protein D3C87_1634320 [compost metagenome]